jgi:hypothetical protein
MNLDAITGAALSLRNWVFLAGVLHFCQVPAMMMAPRMLDWKDDLAKLSVINRRIVQVIGIAIVIVGVGTGIVVACAADEMVKGGKLATGLSLFLAVFWGYRGLVQYTLYLRIWVKGWLGTISNYGLAALFTLLTVIYLIAFIHNLRT